MLCAVDVAARAVLTLLEARAVIAGEVAAIAVTHTRLLPVDRMLLMFDAARFARPRRSIAYALRGTMLLVIMSLINRLRLCNTSHEANAQQRYGGKFHHGQFKLPF
jgi:hypothetical protein